VLFSEPKIPQCVNRAQFDDDITHVSVLFSEPKIPQFARALGRSRAATVSVLFSEPKIPQSV